MYTLHALKFINMDAMKFREALNGNERGNGRCNLGLFSHIFSILLFTVSTIIDAILAEEYLSRGMLSQFQLTMSVLVSSSIVIGGINMLWQTKMKTENSPQNYCFLLITIPYACFVREVKYICGHYGDWIWDLYEIRLLRTYTVLLFSLPSLLLQSYLSMMDETNYIRRTTMGLSVILIIWFLNVWSNLEEPTSLPPSQNLPKRKRTSHKIECATSMVLFILIGALIFISLRYFRLSIMT
ncbi:uncharacterized protein LOC133202612 [Saccostrea echinata]|uniref:uncharacterized protein LOC133202612 n=1 Tax=Saccostrea echinata TaxID=191078 RepID=UPI002A807686|nr:uncharacterized protein LOC133202612 [Saccostrea echinata]